MSTDKITKAYVWGNNNTGELGLGHAARVFSPAPARLPLDVEDLQSGADFTVALTSSGEIWSWGGNGYGQLGDGTRQSRREPKRVRLPGHSKAKALAVGTDHVLVLTSRGDLVSWGRNHRGQLGLGRRSDGEATPQRVAAEPMRAVSAGDAISAAISANGRLHTWGRNGADQLALRGVVDAGTDALRPTRSPVVTSKVAAVDAGLRHLVVLTTDARVLAFGADVTGAPLARHVTLPPRWGKVRAISAGEDHTIALTNRGVVAAWGANDLGQLGVGDREHRLTPVRVSLPGAKGEVTHILAGHRHNLVLTERGEVYTWGDGRVGAVGAGHPKLDAAQFLTPQRIPLTGAVPSGLGGGGYTSVVFVKRGPAVRLELDPPTASASPDRAVRYRIRSVDAFGTDLGPASGQIVASVRGGSATAISSAGLSASGHELGRYSVVARAGHLIGRASLHVQKGTRR